MQQQQAGQALPVEALVVKPGDTLILRIGHAISTQVADQLKSDLRERLPDVEVVIIAGCDQLTAYRPA